MRSLEYINLMNHTVYLHRYDEVCFTNRLCGVCECVCVCVCVGGGGGGGGGE